MTKKEKYLETDLPEQASSLPVDRREFLKRMGALGSGIIVYFTCGDLSVLAQRRGKGGGGKRRRQTPLDFNSLLRIGEDGRVTCLTGKIEMGQGIITSLAQILADELYVSLDSVDMIMGDTDLCPYDRATVGSLTIRVFGPILWAAAAEARGVLIELAAEHLKIPVERLQTKDSFVFDKTNPSNRVSYAQLTQGKKIERHLQGKPQLKPVSEFTIVGKPHLKTDSFEKITGRTKYAGDIRLPNMLYAKILRPPAHGAILKKVNTSAAEETKGVHIVRDGDLIAVLHKYADVAEKALEKVKAEFDVPDSTIDNRTIFDHLLKVAPRGSTESRRGDIKTGENLSSTIVEETYLDPYLAHASIETHTALANMEGEKITVWASTQAPFTVKDQVAQSLGLTPDNVRVITPPVGGGFGGKGSSYQAVEAARLTKLTGRPVQVAWSRAEEFFYDTFRPAAVVKIKSGINDSGDLVLWDYNVYFAGNRGLDFDYEIPNQQWNVYGEWRRIEAGIHPFEVGPWRGPGNNTNVFARESQLDIMASKAGIDPLEFHLKHLKDQRMIGVLEAAAEKFKWTPSKTPSGRGYGLACGKDADTYVACMAEVDVNRDTGQVRVKRVVCAQDMGLVVNPQGATIQAEGCITMGLGFALSEEVIFKGRKVIDQNFDTYEIPRFSLVPEIEIVLIDAQESPPHGGGEPAIICMGGVVANAVFDATGARLFQLPLTPERVKEAIMHS